MTLHVFQFLIFLAKSKFEKRVRNVKMKKMFIYIDCHISCEFELWETQTLSRKQFRLKRTVLIADAFHLTCSDFLAESKIAKRMRDA